MFVFNLRLKTLAAACAAVCATGAYAQTVDSAAAEEGSVVITGTRVVRPTFDLPLSVDAITGAQMRDGQPTVNASEALVRIPGIVAQNRQNYAQDLQISSRGFGARSTFGVRGVRLIADGIPATMPDGQGQAATFNLESARQMEVLRGPYSAIYGNSAGGVIQIFSAEPAQQPTLGGGLWFGSFGSSRASMNFSGRSGNFGAVLDFSRFDTDGYRDHSAATRDHANAKLKWNIGDNASLTFVANSLRQMDTQDPLGLTAAQVSVNPRQVVAQAITFNTRKNIEHDQGGLVYERKLTPNDDLTVLGYVGQRQVVQFLGLQGLTPANSSGGVVDLDRVFGGVGLRWTHRLQLASAPATFTAGIDYDNMEERRKGFVNNNGVAGALKRNEDDQVFNLDPYLQLEWQLAQRWLLTAGVRHNRVKFESKDYFIGGTNPDDSGSIQYTSTNPAAGLLFKLTPTINLYANAGRGFETPTFAELAYRPGGGTGLNFDLKPAKSRSFEIGVKAFLNDNVRVNAALFRIDTRNEIVVLTNVGGRSTFQNASGTRRDGFELSLDGKWNNGVTLAVAYSYLDAVYRDSFLTCGAPPCAAPIIPVPAGNRLPGAPKSTLYTELGWKYVPLGFSTALEARCVDRIFVNDQNSEATDRYAVANLRLGFEQRAGGWKLSEFVRIDNLFDKRYIGSVIVNDGNGRFYEPAPGRNYFAGVNLSHTWK